MGIDRRKIENRYKSGNKSLTTWSLNLDFYMFTINEARDIVLNFNFFELEIFSLEIILRFIISKLSRLVS